MNWFRLYSEARNDAKLRTLSDAEHRVWFNLLCYAAEQKPERGSIFDFDMDVLAIEVAAGDSDLLIETLKKLSRLRIIFATDGGQIRFLKFEGGDDSIRQEWIDMRRRVAPVVYKKYKARCYYCGSPDNMTIDHVHPLSRGGSNNIENLVPACRSCNSRKQNKTVEEWRA